MAKVILGVVQRKENALYEHIEAVRKKKKVTGEQMAEMLGFKSRQTYVNKIRRHSLNVIELLEIMKYLTWTDDEILYYLGTQAGR